MPNCRIWNPLATFWIKDDNIFFTDFHRSTVGIGKLCQQLVHRKIRANGVGIFINICTFLHTLVLQLIISLLTCWQKLIFIVSQLFLDMLIVGTVVGDIQLAVAIYEGQVTIAIQATGMTCSDSNEVTVINIMDRCRSVTINRLIVGILRTTTSRNITTGKDSIVDNDTTGIKTFPFRAIPRTSIRVLTLQFVQRRSRHISSHSIDFINIYLILYQTIRLYHHFTIFSENLGRCSCIIRIYIICAVPSVIITLISLIIAFTVVRFLTDTQCTTCVFVGAIYRTFIASTEDVTIAVCHAFGSSYLTTMDVHMGLSEDEALTLHVERSNKSRIHIHRTITAPAILTATTTEDVAFHLSVKHIDVCCTCFEDVSILILQSTCVTATLHGATSDRTNLTATIEASTYGTAIHVDGGAVNVTVSYITATKDISGEFQVTRLLVVEFLDVGPIRLIGLIGLIPIPDITVVDSNFRRAIYRTTFTTTIYITGDGRSTTIKSISACFTDYYVCLSRTIACSRCSNGTIMVTYVSLVTATIDVTCRTTLDIGIGGSNESIILIIEIWSVKEVINTSGTSTGIDILLDLTAKDSDIGTTIDVTSLCNRSITQTATVGIALDNSTFVDDYIGVMLLLTIQLCCRLVIKFRTVAEMCKTGMCVLGILCVVVAICSTIIIFTCNDWIIIVSHPPGISPVFTPTFLQLLAYRFSILVNFATATPEWVLL